MQGFFLVVLFYCESEFLKSMVTSFLFSDRKMRTPFCVVIIVFGFVWVIKQII